MSNHRAKKSNTGLYVAIVIVAIILLSAGIYYIVRKDSKDTGGSIFAKSLKDETITAENYQDIMDRIEKEFNKDDEEVYYLSYSMLYYITKDGIASAFTNSVDESAMYVNIYGKTVKQLINEGKKLMRDNNVTLEQYKEQVEKSGDN